MVSILRNKESPLHRSRSVNMQNRMTREIKSLSIDFIPYGQVQKYDEWRIRK